MQPLCHADIAPDTCVLPLRASRERKVCERSGNFCKERTGAYPSAWQCYQAQGAQAVAGVRGTGIALNLCRWAKSADMQWAIDEMGRAIRDPRADSGNRPARIGGLLVMAAGHSSITEGVILVATIVGWNWLLDWLSSKSPLIARLVRPGHEASSVGGSIVDLIGRERRAQMARDDRDSEFSEMRTDRCRRQTSKRDRQGVD